MQQKPNKPNPKPSYRTLQSYILEVRGLESHKIGDLSKDLACEIDNLDIPADCWIYVRKLN